jgi:hypothetical protein
MILLLTADLIAAAEVKPCLSGLQCTLMSPFTAEALFRPAN